MILDNSITIDASTERIWPFISDPRNIMKWNPKVISVDDVTLGRLRIGFQYRITYEMGQKRLDFDAEIVASEEPRYFKIKYSERFHENPKNFNRKFYEEFILVNSRNGTKLTQKIHLINSGINIFFKGIIWFVTKFGKSVGEVPLLNLKRLVEVGEK